MLNIAYSLAGAWLWRFTSRQWSRRPSRGASVEPALFWTLSHWPYTAQNVLILPAVGWTLSQYHDMKTGSKNFLATKIRWSGTSHGLRSRVVSLYPCRFVFGWPLAQFCSSGLELIVWLQWESPGEISWLEKPEDSLRVYLGAVLHSSFFGALESDIIFKTVIVKPICQLLFLHFVTVNGTNFATFLKKCTVDLTDAIC